MGFDTVRLHRHTVNSAVDSFPRIRAVHSSTFQLNLSRFRRCAAYVSSTPSVFPQKVLKVSGKVDESKLQMLYCKHFLCDTLGISGIQ